MAASTNTNSPDQESITWFDADDDRLSRFAKTAEQGSRRLPTAGAPGTARRPRRTTRRQLYQNASLALFRMRHKQARTATGTVCVVVPAHNEEDTIARTITALLKQTRRPDRIVIVADNCTDRTVEIARSFGQRVTVVETVGNKHRKVGALTLGWQQYVSQGYDYMLGVDADTVLSPELARGPRAGAPGEPEGRRHHGPLHLRPRARADASSPACSSASSGWSSPPGRWTSSTAAATPTCSAGRRRSSASRPCRRSSRASAATPRGTRRRRSRTWSSPGR